MDTRQLAAFCAVVDRKSFSLAAEQLGVTQPAVSLQIRSLEKRLGERLLDRSGRRVEPTEAGRRLYRGADDPLLFGSRLADQYEIARRHHGFTDAELAELARQSVRASAASAEDREKFLADIDAWLA